MPESITTSETISKTSSGGLFSAQNVAALLCFAYGLCLLANIYPLCDGQWFWYSILHHQGRHLYADFHLALQPLFILEMEWTHVLFGNSWLAIRLLGLFHLLAFIAGLRWVGEYLPIKNWQRAVLTTCAFALATLFVAYRFDDYHVLADCFEVFSICLLLRLSRQLEVGRNAPQTAVMLGIFSGLSLTTRLNDGAFLLISVLIALAVLVPQNRLLVLSLCSLAAFFTVLAVVGLTGDQLRDYASYSIFHAAGSKGGLWSVLIAPVRLPFKTLKILITTPSYFYAIFPGVVVTLCVAIAFYGFPFSRRTWSRRQAILFSSAVILVALMVKGTFSSAAAVVLCGLFLIAGFLLALQIAVQAVFTVSGRSLHGWQSLSIIFLIPFSQLLSASMSSGGVFFGLYAPVGLMILLLPIAMPSWMERMSLVKNALMACAAVMVISTVVAKIEQPYAWHTYVEPPMFTERQWYQHPLYGPMYIRTSQLSLSQRICQNVSSKSQPVELLSLPFPYANYFCGVKPWGEYVQTFFDLTSAQQMAKLMSDLDSNPPHWILYQRQPRILELHENIYNRGLPLPQRKLDVQIMNKLASGEWANVLEEDSGHYRIADWTATYNLINTRPEAKKNALAKPKI